MRKAFLALVFSFSSIALAQCPAESTLFFGNGMFNSHSSAQKSLDTLKSRLSESENWKRERSHLAYNYDENTACKRSRIFRLPTLNGPTRFFADRADRAGRLRSSRSTQMKCL